MGSVLSYAADRNEGSNPANFNPCTVTSTTDWVDTAPLESLKTTPLIDSAVSVGLGTEESPINITFAWDSPIVLTYFGLHDTNLVQRATVRLKGWIDAAMTDQVAEQQVNIIPPLIRPGSLPFGAPNQFRGDLDPRDFGLLPANAHIVVPLCRVRRAQISIWGPTFQADGTADTAVRIGLAWAGHGLRFNRRVGSGERYRSGDQRIEGDGGSVWVEPGIGRRMALIDQSVIDQDHRDELFRMAMRVGRSKPIVWLPNVESPAECAMYGGLFRRVDDHEHKYIAPDLTSGSLEYEEWRE